MSKDFAKVFYRSDAWRRTREAYFKYRCGICERCGAAGDIVHHKKYLTPLNINDARITLDFRNLELLCQDCHNKEHFTKDKTNPPKKEFSPKNKRYSFGTNGEIIPPTSSNGDAPREPVKGE